MKKKAKNGNAPATQDIEEIFIAIKRELAIRRYLLESILSIVLRLEARSR